MGDLTRAQLVSAGLNKAGNTDLTTLANVWFNAWLRSTYAAWPWPFLQRRITAVSLTTGATSLSLGNGSNGVTAEIQRIHDPIWIGQGTYSTRALARIRQLHGGDAEKDEYLRPSTEKGLCTEFKVRADSSSPGRWTLIPYPFPDKNYLLAIDYQERPAAISADATVPPYPNDRTMIQAVICDALQYMKDPAYRDELEVLAAMVVDDRVKFGEVTGLNDELGLDPKTFR